MKPLSIDGQLAACFLAFVRVSGLFLAVPFYSAPAAPIQVKAGLALLLTACLVPLLGPESGGALAAFAGPLSLGLAVLGELAVGFMIGLAASAVIAAAQTAGELIAQDIGLTIGNVIDPISNAQTSVLGQLLAGLALFTFLALDFHHQAVRLLAETFRLLPLGGVLDRLLGGAGPSRLAAAASGQGSVLFDAAVRLGLPVAVCLLLVTVAMGLLSRAVPEMNILILGFGVRVLVGLWVLILALPVLGRAFQALFERAAAGASGAIRALAGS